MRIFVPHVLLTLALSAAALPAPAVLAMAVPRSSHGADALKERLDARLAAVTTKLDEGRKAGRITPAQASRMKRRLTWVRTDAAANEKQQGFLSAGESASYHRVLDDVESKLKTPAG